MKVVCGWEAEGMAIRLVSPLQSSVQARGPNVIAGLGFRREALAWLGALLDGNKSPSRECCGWGWGSKECERKATERVIPVACSARFDGAFPHNCCR